MESLKKDLELAIKKIIKLDDKRVLDYKLLYATNDDKLKDMDIILIVKDQINLYYLLCKASLILIPLIKKYKMLFTCFPVKESIYNNPNTNSQFILNIKLNGQHL